VLAHPAYGSGDQLILGDELEERVEHLINFGLEGLEACYSGFPEKLRRSTIALADRHSLYVTAGATTTAQISWSCSATPVSTRSRPCPRVSGVFWRRSGIRS